MTEFEQAALGYIYDGLEVFPLWPAQKNPLVPQGLHDASNDIVTVTEWWRKWPTANIGIRVPERHIVIDIDPRSGGDLKQLGKLPTTSMARTGGGGWHLWFKYVGRARGKLGDAVGIDIKSHSGYIVAPPSIHPSGGRYRWLNDAPVVGLPNSLLWRVMPEPPKKYEPTINDGTSAGGLIYQVSEAEEGNRNHVLFWATCRAYEEGGDPAVLDALQDAARVCGLQEFEIEATMRSARYRSA